MVKVVVAMFNKRKRAENNMFAELERDLEEIKVMISKQQINTDAMIEQAVIEATTPLQKYLDEVKKELDETKQELDESKNEIKRLNAIINKDSSTSSKPPSTDGLKRVINSREKSGKKQGGQKGHEVIV